jgi:thioredoxin reductase (NADPH)
MTQHDAVVVGSGPAGYTAALYLGRAGRTVAVLEGRASGGGALMATSEIENFPGLPDGATGPELMWSMRRQAERFGAELVNQDAIDVDVTGPKRRVTAGDGTAYDARVVVLASGSRHRRLSVEGEDRLTGRGVSSCATCDAAFFRGRDVVVVGGGDSAAEEAIFLARIAARVHVVHRSRNLRASQVLRARLAAYANVTMHLDSRVVRIEGDERVTGVLVENNPRGTLTSLAADAVFVAIGHTPRSELVAGSLTLSATGHVEVDHPSTRTTIPGVFACGDLVDPTYRQAVTAAGSGCAAALDAEAYLLAESAYALDGEAVAG